VALKRKPKMDYGRYKTGELERLESMLNFSREYRSRVGFTDEFGNHFWLEYDGNENDEQPTPKEYIYLPSEEPA
jgi:hypothetical protein